MTELIEKLLGLAAPVLLAAPKKVAKKKAAPKKKVAKKKAAPKKRAAKKAVMKPMEEPMAPPPPPPPPAPAEGTPTEKMWGS